MRERSPVDSRAQQVEGPIQQRQRLRTALLLVEGMTGLDRSAGDTHDEASTGAAAYAAATPVARRRFDLMVAEAGTFAAAGIAALIRHRVATGRDCKAAAEQLATEIRVTLAALDRIVERA